MFLSSLLHPRGLDYILCVFGSHLHFYFYMSGWALAAIAASGFSKLKKVLSGFRLRDIE
jgi:hypothetical protein